MGCFGIGVSRLLAALAEVHSDGQGLKWPENIAPFGTSIIADNSVDQEILTTFGPLPIFVDDRENMSYGKRLKDHMLTGFPKTIVFGHSWRSKGAVEVHDRLKGTVELVQLSAVNETL